jgi:hypothetical protein
VTTRKPKPLPPAGSWPVGLPGNKLTGPLRMGTHHLPGMPSITVTVSCPPGFYPHEEFVKRKRQRKAPPKNKEIDNDD